MLPNVAKVQSGVKYGSTSFRLALDIHGVAATRDTKFEKSVGAKIRAFRQALGWSQQKLADNSNIEKKQVQRIENAENSARLLIIVAIAKALGRQPFELLKTDHQVKSQVSIEPQKKG